MTFFQSTENGKSFRTLITPIPSDISEKSFEDTFPSLKYKSKPADDSWIQVHQEGKINIIFSLNLNANDGTIAQKFRLLVLKTHAQWIEEVALDANHLEDKLGAALRGMEMATYEIGSFKSEKKDLQFPVQVEVINASMGNEIFKTAQIRAESQMRAMHLVDLPPNRKTPAYIGEWAQKSAENYGFQCEVWNHERVVAEGLHALYAVGKGSEHKPVFIISQYFGDPENKKCHLALVGKGITFDSGGISIKPSANLHYMKSDMAGAGAMLASIETAARLKLRINVACIIPSAENAVDSCSFRPGDIIESYSGKTIEIIDTDAEGRLILADGLAWTKKNLNPELMIDMATLTGSSVRALGKEAAALYSENESLSKLLLNAGQKTGEKLWPMPLWDDYNSYIHSDLADVSNLPLSPVAGSIAAAKFLQVFADGHPAWAHIDMPGMSFGDSPFAKMKSATGYGVQLLTEVMQILANNPDIAGR